jgi:hypothetical protein
VRPVLDRSIFFQIQAVRPVRMVHFPPYFTYAMTTKKPKTDPPTVTMIRPQDIVVSEQVQSRVRTDPAVVREYTDAMERGDRFPPIVVFFNILLNIYYVADGFHRLLAHKNARPNDLIQVEQYLGTEQDALWFSVAANKVHGLQRTNEDKRNAAELALLHPNGRPLSDRNIAAYLGVSHPMVRRIRLKLESEGKLEKCLSRTGADGRVYNIDRKPQAECTCADCAHYARDSSCMIEGEEYPSDKPACEHFFYVQPDEPDTVEDAEPEFASPDIGIYFPKVVRHRAFRRRAGKYLQVPLSRTDTSYAAWMIRKNFDDNYAAALGLALIEQVRNAAE